MRASRGTGPGRGQPGQLVVRIAVEFLGQDQQVQLLEFLGPVARSRGMYWAGEWAGVAADAPLGAVVGPAGGLGGLQRWR